MEKGAKSDSHVTFVCTSTVLPFFQNGATPAEIRTQLLIVIGMCPCFSLEVFSKGLDDDTPLRAWQIALLQERGRVHSGMLQNLQSTLWLETAFLFFS